MHLISLLLNTFFMLGATPATTTPAAAHEFHLSKCMIEYSPADEALQIMLHVYLDDLEEALRQQGADKLFLCTEKEDPKAETYLYRYLQQVFQLNVNGQNASYSFVGKEQSEDLQAVWCYLEITDIEQVKHIEMNNSLLMEVFDDQKNIVHIVAAKNNEEHFLFQKGHETEQASFE